MRITILHKNVFLKNVHLEKVINLGHFHTRKCPGFYILPKNIHKNHSFEDFSFFVVYFSK